jgi:D-glycerate 3-kinase
VDAHVPQRASLGQPLIVQRTRPWVLGIQGPQGCGKSALAAGLVEALSSLGTRAVSVSIDDFYLTYADQCGVAARHAGNPYMLYRGYPGTHDVGLGARTLDALRALRAGDTTTIPTYDKSAHGGRGDRSPLETWPVVAGPLDVIVVEGWMLGFAPVPEETLEPALRTPNTYLAAYSAWTERLDALLAMHVDSFDTVVRWRIDAERARRERGKTALSDEEARDYIQRFRPAYRVYVPELRAHPPCACVRLVTLAGDRSFAEP